MCLLVVHKHVFQRLINAVQATRTLIATQQHLAYNARHLGIPYPQNPSGAATQRRFSAMLGIVTPTAVRPHHAFSA